jgi:hypothetical protein
VSTKQNFFSIGYGLTVRRARARKCASVYCLKCYITNYTNMNRSVYLWLIRHANENHPLIVQILVYFGGWVQPVTEPWRWHCSYRESTHTPRPWLAGKRGSRSVRPYLLANTPDSSFNRVQQWAMGHISQLQPIVAILHKTTLYRAHCMIARSTGHKWNIQTRADT